MYTRLDKSCTQHYSSDGYLAYTYRQGMGIESDTVCLWDSSVHLRKSEWADCYVLCLKGMQRFLDKADNLQLE